MYTKIQTKYMIKIKIETISTCKLCFYHSNFKFQDTRAQVSSNYNKIHHDDILFIIIYCGLIELIN